MIGSMWLGRSSAPRLTPPEGLVAAQRRYQTLDEPRAQQGTQEAAAKWEELAALGDWWVRFARKNKVRGETEVCIPNRRGDSATLRRAWIFYFKPASARGGSLVVLQSGAIFHHVSDHWVSRRPDPSWVLGTDFEGRDVVAGVKDAMAKKLLEQGVVLDR